MIQNELLDCMFEVYREKIATQVAETSFVAVQVDQTTAMSRISQLVLVLRYILTDVFWSLWKLRIKPLCV